MISYTKASLASVFGVVAALSPLNLNVAILSNAPVGAAMAMTEGDGGKARINLAGKLKTLSQEIAASACDIGAGLDLELAEADLERSLYDFESIIAALEHGDVLLGIPSPEEDLKTLHAIEQLHIVWDPLDAAVKTLLENGDAQAAKLILAQNLELLNSADILASQITGQYSDPAQLLQVDAMAIGIAGRQRMLSQQIRKEACELNNVDSGITDPTGFQATVDIFEKSLVALRDGMPDAGVRPPPNEGIAEELNKTWEHWSGVKPILEKIAQNGSGTSEDIHQVNEIAHKLMLDMDNIITRYMLAIPGSEDVYRVPLRAFAETKLTAWMEEPTVIDALRAQNSNNAGLTQTRIDALDKQWRSETELILHPLIDEVMSRPASVWLKEKQDTTAGFVTEVFVMDNVGINVAQSGVTSDYWQGDEAKWQETFGNGSGEIHISDVEFDDSTQVYQSQVSLPIFDPDTSELIGAVTFGVNVQSLL